MLNGSSLSEGLHILATGVPSYGRAPWHEECWAIRGSVVAKKTDISGTLCLQFRQNKPPCFQTLLRPLNTHLFPIHSAVEGVRENHDVVQQLGSNQVVAM
jgi:hypothetical protein